MYLQNGFKFSRPHRIQTQKLVGIKNYIYFARQICLLPSKHLPFLKIVLFKPALFYCRIRCFVKNSQVLAGPVLSAIFHLLPLKLTRNKYTEEGVEGYVEVKVNFVLFLEAIINSFFFYRDSFSYVQAALIRSKILQKRETVAQRRKGRHTGIFSVPKVY